MQTSYVGVVASALLRGCHAPTTLRLALAVLWTLIVLLVGPVRGAMCDEGPVPLGGPQPPIPDLSHLTEEERRIIEGVMFRQQKEEEKEMEILR